MLVGGGHAHVQILRRWAMARPRDLRLLVVLDRPVAVYSGMVPGLVAGQYEHHELEIDVVPLARRAGAGVLMTPAVDLDPVTHTLSLEGRPPIHYDTISLDVGSTVRGLDLPGVREHALATRPIGTFVGEVDRRALALARLGRPPRVALVGGGAAGVELAFALEARLRGAGVRGAFEVVTTDEHVLAGVSGRVRERVEDEMRRRGITTRAGERVVAVRADGLVVEPASAGQPDGGPADAAGPTDRPADLVVWATGAAPISFPRHAGLGRLACDAAGFIEVRDTLQSIGFDDVFAVGDCARLVDARWVPRAGVYAVRQGPVLEHNLRARLEGRRLRRYRPQRDFLSLLTLGDGRALGHKWGFAARGRVVARLKDAIDRRFMRRFQILDREGRPRPEAARLGAMGVDGAPGAETRGGGSSEMGRDMACGGCAAKLGAEPLRDALALLPEPPADPSVLLGLAERDDVAATRDAHGETTLHNVDVIRAFCDDPWLVGRVAAANALSDLHAKGGRPRYAQAIIGLPDLAPDAGRDRLFQVLSGIRATLDPLAVSLLGGHTTIGDDLTVGLAVTGDGASAAALLQQRGAQPGDVLLLTQPLGTGVVLAADMQGLARGAWVQAAHAVMQHTNDVAGRIALEYGVHAATDVTGFGLAGHLSSLLATDGDGLRAHLSRSRIPLLPGAATLFGSALRSTAHPANAAGFRATIVGASEEDEAWLFDPQTAGGLLLAVAEADEKTTLDALHAAGESAATRIGRLVPADDPKRATSAAIEIVA